MGAAAFAVFHSKGAMKHSLTEPIPGAPAIAATDDQTAALDRALKALADFDKFNGALQPHFAYGRSTKGYAAAHANACLQPSDRVFCRLTSSTAAADVKPASTGPQGCQPGSRAGSVVGNQPIELTAQMVVVGMRLVIGARPVTAPEQTLAAQNVKPQASKREHGRCPALNHCARRCPQPIDTAQGDVDGITIPARRCTARKVGSSAFAAAGLAK